MGPAAPLMTLRDLLELSCESSCSDGFRSYPRRLPWHADDAALQANAKEEAAPVRLLIEADLRRSPSRTLSSILFPKSPGSLATVSRLTRSLSQRLIFWRRHRGEDDDDDERDSLGLPSPVVSSCSASQCSEHAESVAEAADPPVPEEHNSGASEFEKPSTSWACTQSVNDADNGATAGDGHKALDGDPAGSSVESMEDKQQLSPVSVMDFPFHHDDGDERSDAGTCSPSFQQRQHDLERSSSSAHELLPHKIRRLDGLAQAAVDPVDLEPRFVASDASGASVSDDTHQAQSDSSSTSTATSTTLSTDEQHRSADERHQSADDAECKSDLRHRLLIRVLKDDNDDGMAATSDVTERLLLDFFAEGLDRGRSSKVGTLVRTVKPSDDHDQSVLVRAAKEWVQGAGTPWGVEDVLFAGPAALADMDRWMCVGEEEREVGVAVEWLVLDALVTELVCDLALAGRC